MDLMNIKEIFPAWKAISGVYVFFYSPFRVLVSMFSSLDLSFEINSVAISCGLLTHVISDPKNFMD